MTRKVEETKVPQNTDTFNGFCTFWFLELCAHVKAEPFTKKEVCTPSGNRGHMILESKYLEGKQLFLNKTVMKPGKKNNKEQNLPRFTGVSKQKKRALLTEKKKKKAQKTFPKY